MVARVTFVVSMLVGALSLAGCGKPGGPPGPGGPPELGFVTVTAHAQPLTTELTGRVTPSRIAEVRPQVGGIILERPFTEGAQIAADQVLYRIDPAIYQADYDNAKAVLARARATLERARLRAERYANLAKTKAASPQEYEDAEAALKEAMGDVAAREAALETARIRLQFTRVTSPIAGKIGRSAVTQGALVTASQQTALATVQQLDPIFVDLTRSNRELLQLRRALEDGRLQRGDGERVQVLLSLEDGSPYGRPGRLEFTEVTVDRGTGAVTLRATFPNPDAVLLPGMFVRARVEEGVRPDAILVPQQGVSHNRLGQPTALVLAPDDKVELRVLEIDRAVGNRWLVNKGLNPGDRLIVEGTQKAKPGEPARGVDVSNQPEFSAPPPPAAGANAAGRPAAATVQPSAAAPAPQPKAGG